MKKSAPNAGTAQSNNRSVFISVLPRQSDAEDLRILDIRRKQEEVIIQAVVEINPRSAVEAYPGAAKHTALMNVVDVVEGVLHADPAVVGSAAQIQPSFPERPAHFAGH